MSDRTDDGISDAQLLRYSRHILLDEFGIEAQARLLAARALVIGAGGLGSPVALYLGSAGVGTITIVDDDAVDLTNLQRQIAHTAARIGRAKVDSAAEAISAINPDVRVVALRERADAERLAKLVGEADVVIDCSDNFATRQAVNAACVAHARPLVSGAAIRFDGQVSVFDTRDPRAPCYACVFPPAAAFEETACATLGVFAPLVGIVGSMQAAEALKLLAGIGSSLAGRLQMLDARSMEWTELGLRRDDACAVCARLRPTADATHPVVAPTQEAERINRQ
jgi:molybdopterin/thiamine biosynthesis adenylyltransferase